MSFLKLRQSSDDIAPQPLPIIDGYNPVTKQTETWAVLVRYRTQAERDALWNASSKREINRVSRQMEQVLDLKKWNLSAPDAFICGWDNCTPSAIRALVLLDEDPPTDEHGHIPYTSEVAREFWACLPSLRFADPIVKTADGILEVLELEKKLDLISSAA